jgi:glycosyltransferase involved in cell wall biosynthesis
MVTGRLKGSHPNPMNTYFERYAYPIKLFDQPVSASLKISVVIPCFNEPDILSSLNSLNNCHPVAGVEVIIIVNEPYFCDDEISDQNSKTLGEIEDWKQYTKLNFNLLNYHLIAPEKDAGVGLARKVGMDEAARRFEKIDQTNGIICCFDADSTCAPNYLEAIYQHFFNNNQRPHGGAVHFEHVFPMDDDLREGIIQYELHLRYYVSALRMIGYPFAHQTVGSSMVVRADIYQKVGGMNKRKAGEDFYFLHRLMPTGNFIDIKNTSIYPSARVSDRVPFGTGKAMEKWQNVYQSYYPTYNLASFCDLKKLFSKTEAFYMLKEDNYIYLLENLPLSIKKFLDHNNFKDVVNRLNRQSNSLPSFIKKWYQYFDGFRVLKFIHFSRDNFYEEMPVSSQAAKLGKILWPSETIKLTTTTEWLSFYRQKDKS